MVSKAYNKHRKMKDIANHPKRLYLNKIKQTKSKNDIYENYRLKISHRRIIMGIVAAFLFIFFFVSLISSGIKFSNANSDLSSTNEKLVQEKTKNKKLHKDLKNLKNPSSLKGILRNKYQYSKSNEIIFKFK